MLDSLCCQESLPDDIKRRNTTPDQLSDEDRGKLNILLLYVLKELESGKSNEDVVQSLVQKGLPTESATDFVQRAMAFPHPSRELERSIRADKYWNRMWEGCGLVVLGALITGATYLLAEDLGGQYIICWGAMAGGVLYLLVGLIGWLANS